MTIKSKRILVLEDNEPIAELIRFYFDEAGYDVKVINLGGELIKNIKDFKPDLITIDIELPDSDGMDLFRKLQAQPNMKSIPVIFISVHADQQDLGLQLGAKGFVIKPFAESDLQKVVLAVLES